MMDELKGYLKKLEPGPVEQTRHLERLLAKVWDDLDGGNESGMTGHKLSGRMEHAEWHPPRLSFVVERHGGTVLGSSRGELQHWAIDLDQKTASCERTGHRQLYQMATRVEVQPIADEIAGKILAGETDHRLRWLPDERVRVEMGTIFPRGSGFQQTVEGRRRRLREKLIESLSPRGWVHLGRNTFRLSVPPTATS
jgi:hypothetical protein